MRIPIEHDDTLVRRWPIITLALIVINAVVFLGTHWVIDEPQAH
jgi:hypothetical protein